MPRKPTSPTSALRQAETQVRVARALTRMREGHSATVASHETGTTLRTMRRYAGRALRQEPSGHYAVASGDRLPRRLRMLTPAGLIAVDTRGSKEASEVARYLASVQRYVRTGDDGPLQTFRGKSVGRGRQSVPYVTDLPTIERLEHAGELQFEDLYESHR